MPGQRWTKDELESLRRQLAASGGRLQDVRIKDRTAHAVRTQAVRLGLIRARDSRWPWPKRQRDLLAQLKQAGFTPLQIYQYELLGDPPRSRWAITKQWGRMNLADRKRSSKMRRKKQWKPGERKQFDDFLKRHSETMTPEQIAKVWNVARSTVARRQTELGLKMTREAVLQMDYSQAKQQRARQRMRRGNLRRWERHRQEKEDSLVRLAERLRSHQRPPAEQTCTDCGRSWPKRKDFFHTRDKRISIGTSRYYKHRCVLCENQRRRDAERDRKRDSSRVADQ
jgi:hypothetical protein